MEQKLISYQLNIRLRWFNNGAKHIGLLLTLWIPQLFTIGQSTSLSEEEAFTPVFKENSDNFNVLVLPFRKMCGQYRDVGLAIEANLGMAAKRDSLNIRAVYFDTIIQSAVNEEYAKELKRAHNASMVIYGRYFTEECSSDNIDEYCYNYVSDMPRGLQKVAVNSEFNLYPSSYSDILKNKLSGDINFIIYYIQAVYNLSLNKNENAIKFFQEALLKSSMHSETVYSELIDLMCKEKKFDEAILFMNNQYDNPEIRNTDLLFNLKYRYFLSLINYRANRYDEAILQSEKILEIIDTVEEVNDFFLLQIFQHQSYLYTSTGYNDKAKYVLKKGIDIELNKPHISPNTIFQYIHISFYSHNYELTKRLLDKVEKNIADTSSGFYEFTSLIFEENYCLNRKNLLLLEGNTSEGLLYWDKLINYREKKYGFSSRKVIYSYYNRARFHMAAGDIEHAISFLEKGLEYSKTLGANGDVLQFCFYSRLEALYKKLLLPEKRFQIQKELNFLNSKYTQVDQIYSEFFDSIMAEEAVDLPLDFSILNYFDEEFEGQFKEGYFLLRQAKFFLLN